MRTLTQFTNFLIPSNYSFCWLSSLVWSLSRHRIVSPLYSFCSRYYIFSSYVQYASSSKSFEMNTLFSCCTVEKFLLSNFFWSQTPLFGHILKCIWGRMWPKSDVWDHKKFDSKNFFTVRKNNRNLSIDKRWTISNN